MKDPRYRNPARPANPNEYMRPPRGNSGAVPPEYDDEYGPRPPRGPRDSGRRPPRDRDEFAPDFERERRPPRGPRDPGMPPTRGPRYPDGERPRRGMGRPEGREEWPDPRSAPDWEPGMRPRRPSRPPGRASGRRKGRAAHRLHWRYRYGALLGMMLFAAVGGVCLGFSGIEGHGASIGLIVAGIPALLLSLGCAAVYIYF